MHFILLHFGRCYVVADLVKLMETCDSANGVGKARSCDQSVLVHYANHKFSKVMYILHIKHEHIKNSSLPLGHLSVESIILTFCKLTSLCRSRLLQIKSGEFTINNLVLALETHTLHIKRDL